MPFNDSVLYPGVEAGLAVPIPTFDPLSNIEELPIVLVPVNFDT